MPTLLTCLKFTCLSLKVMIKACLLHQEVPRDDLEPRSHDSTYSGKVFHVFNPRSPSTLEGFRGEVVQRKIRHSFTTSTCGSWCSLFFHTVGRSTLVNDYYDIDQWFQGKMLNHDNGCEWFGNVGKQEDSIIAVARSHGTSNTHLGTLIHLDTLFASARLVSIGLVARLEALGI